MPRNGLAPDGRLPSLVGLRLRLPLLMVLTIVSALATFLWYANHAVEEALVRSGGERAQSEADRLAALFERSSQQVADQLSALAAHPDVVSLLEHPSKVTREAAETRLRST